VNSLEAARTHQRTFLEQLKAKKEPYIIQVQGIDVVVYPGVFPPVTDSRLLAAYIKVNPHDRILDLTTGSGVSAIVAGLQGATGLAVDLNPAAVVNANENFKRFNIQFESLDSDLFKNVPLERFDQIFVNGPYTEGEITDPLELSFYGAQQFLSRLFSQAHAYLKQKGRILITFAEWGDLNFFERTATSNGFDIRIVDKKTSDNERTYRLYEAKLSRP